MIDCWVENDERGIFKYITFVEYKLRNKGRVSVFRWFIFYNEIITKQNIWFKTIVLNVTGGSVKIYPVQLQYSS